MLTRSRCFLRGDTIVSYVVNWRGSDGQAGWHPVADLQEAAGHVEHLRNNEGVTETKIFKLDEVPFELRQVYRVEIAVADEPAPTFSAPVEPAPAPAVVEAPIEAPAWTPEPEAAPEAVAQPVFEAAAAAEPVLAEVGADDGASNGQRRGLFGR